MKTVIQILFTFFLYSLAALLVGIAAYPAVIFILEAGKHFWPVNGILDVLALCIIVSASYFVFGLALILTCGVFQFVLRLKLKPGEHRMDSPAMLQWMLTNAIVHLVANMFMDFMLLTPLLPIFYRMMGAKLGKDVQINSKRCADLSLLEIGDNTVIGGHSTVIGHSFERGKLILNKVKIGKNVVIGLNSVVLPGAEIGDHAILAAGAVLGKNAKMEAHGVYAGVPAQLIRGGQSGDMPSQ